MSQINSNSLLGPSYANQNLSGPSQSQTASAYLANIKSEYDSVALLGSNPTRTTAASFGDSISTPARSASRVYDLTLA